MGGDRVWAHEFADIEIVSSMDGGSVTLGDLATNIEDGFEETVVRRVAGMVIRNEYKRRQSAPGVRITSRAFGRDRRYPITSGYRFP